MADIIYPGDTPSGTLGAEQLPSNFDLKLWRGDAFTFQIALKNPDGTAMNLTGYTAKATIKSITDPPVTYAFESTITPAAGTVDYKLTSVVSATIPAGEYIWDVQTTDPSGNVKTHIAGDVLVFEQVTV